MTTNAVYEKRGSALTFVNTGGTELLNLKALAAVTGRLSSFYDRGTGAAPAEYEVRAYTKWVATPAVNETLHVYLCQSDGTHADAGLTYHDTNDAAVTLAQCTNLKMIGIVNCDTADTNEHGATFIVRITSRYFAIAVYNGSAAKTLVDTDSLSAVVVTPIYPDIQQAA
jgi:hypothetical protein